MTIFRAALNLAYENGKITSDNAWKRVKQLPNADVAKIQYLDDAESKALAEACPTDLKPIVTAALLTGADYSELYKAKVSAFEARDQRLTVAQKREKRTIALGDEAMAFFVGATKDRGKDEIMFSRSNGKPWGSTHHSRPFALAVAKAGITRPASEPKITFHILRHSYAVRMLRRGMPMHQVSKQLGHKSILITQKHYAHVLEDDVMISVKAMAGELGIVSQCATDPC
jgi:integrase